MATHIPHQQGTYPKVSSIRFKPRPDRALSVSFSQTEKPMNFLAPWSTDVGHNLQQWILNTWPLWAEIIFSSFITIINLVQQIKYRFICCYYHWSFVYNPYEFIEKVNVISSSSVVKNYNSAISEKENQCLNDYRQLLSPPPSIVQTSKQVQNRKKFTLTIMITLSD